MTWLLGRYASDVCKCNASLAFPAIGCVQMQCLPCLSCHRMLRGLQLTNGHAPCSLRVCFLRQCGAATSSWLKSHDWHDSGHDWGLPVARLPGSMGAGSHLQVHESLPAADVQTFRRAALLGLVAEAKAVISELECVLPACESGILRHVVIHIAERIAIAGPPWVHAMWAWERMWATLIRWLKQRNHPAISLMNSYHAFALARSRCVTNLSQMTLQSQVVLFDNACQVALSILCQLQMQR